MKKILIAAFSVFLTASICSAASWKTTDDEDTSINGGEIVFLENEAGDGNNWMELDTIKDWLQTAFGSVFAPVLGADDNYVTDAEKIVIGNTSGENTGDQDLSGKLDTSVLDDTTNATDEDADAKIWSVDKSSTVFQKSLGTIGAAGLYPIEESALGVTGKGIVGNWKMFYSDASGGNFEQFDIGTAGYGLVSQGTAGAPQWLIRPQTITCTGTDKVSSFDITTGLFGCTTDEEGAGGSDAAAIHDDTAAEIYAITEKSTPVSGDWLLIEDSEASNAKKKLQVGNLPGGTGEANVQSDWNVSDTESDAYILNKPTIPTALSALSDDSTHRLTTDTEKSTWNGKQDALTNPLVQTDVDDTPENGATTVPVSSNWAYDHAAAADPHAGYMLESNIGFGANNYLKLAASPGTPDGTKVLRDDGTWVAPSATITDLDNLPGDTVDDDLIDQAIIAGYAATAAPGFTPLDSDSPGTDKTAGFIGWQYVDGADGAENSDFLLQIMQGGSLATILAFDESDDQFETSKVINSSVASGTAPFVVASNTVVTNLNASLLEGHAASYFQTALTNPVVQANLGTNVYTFLGTPSVSNFVAALSDEGAFAADLLGYANAAAVFTGIKQAATTSATGVAELADTTETSAGTVTDRVVTPDGLSGSVYGQKEIGWTVVDDDTDTAVADGLQAGVVPASMNGMNLVDMTCSVGSVTGATSGATTVVLRRVRGATAADMTSTGVTIDYDAYTASDETVNTSNDDVATGDKIFVDINGVSAGAAAKGLSCTAVFQTP